MDSKVLIFWEDVILGAAHLTPVHPWMVQVTATNVDIACVAPTYHLYTKEEIEEVVSRL